MDFPQPDGPITATASPGRISSDTPSSATVSPYSLRTPSRRTTVSLVMGGTLRTPYGKGIGPWCDIAPP
ncbi:hypothetical protein Acy02nite_26280 [Actinoplanes cyaneus]|uniref:Uncharacterized protein n=1 Tax=Actinoplanes cyaneus TaxID=52696 RepID=A0A919M3P0_9ACTN|nr:hypothetical protein Acy02nite_26280 [Actinoplanes cyaneus]